MKLFSKKKRKKKEYANDGPYGEIKILEPRKRRKITGDFCYCIPYIFLFHGLRLDEVGIGS